MKGNIFNRIISPGTRAFLREARSAKDFSFYDFLHGYIYGRWIYLYIGIGIGEHPLAKKYGPLFKKVTNIFKSNTDTEKKPGMAETYHGKVVPLKAASELVMINQAIDLPGLEQVIPYQRATDIIMRNPDHIVALECPCRSSRSEPCLPLDVCLVVGEPFAGFVMEHSRDRAKRISQAEAVQILQKEDERGHVHHAFFKDAMLGRFYAICNCCSCCCGAMQSQRNGNPMLASSGYVCQVDEDLCMGCGNCESYCQFEALSIPNGYAYVEKTACMGCGICIDKCDQGALALTRAPSRGEPLEIHKLMAEAALHSAD